MDMELMMRDGGLGWNLESPRHVWTPSIAPLTEPKAVFTRQNGRTRVGPMSLFHGAPPFPFIIKYRNRVGQIRYPQPFIGIDFGVCLFLKAAV